MAQGKWMLVAALSLLPFVADAGRQNVLLVSGSTQDIIKPVSKGGGAKPAVDSDTFALYQFNETRDIWTVLDQTKTQDLTNWSSGAPQPIGMVGWASRLLNGTGYIGSASSSNAAIISGFSGSYTVNAWVRWDNDDLTKNHTVFVQGYYGSVDPSRYNWRGSLTIGGLTNPGQIRVKFHSGIKQSVEVWSDPAKPIPAATWVHLGYTLAIESDNTATVRIYIDGDLVTTAAGLSRPEHGAEGHFYLGRDGDMLNYYKGGLDEFRLDKRAFSAAEMKAMTFNFCGDGVLSTALGEECDDGNTDNDDGCSAACKVEGGHWAGFTDAIYFRSATLTDIFDTLANSNNWTACFAYKLDPVNHGEVQFYVAGDFYQSYGGFTTLRGPFASTNNVYNHPRNILTTACFGEDGTGKSRILTNFGDGRGFTSTIMEKAHNIPGSTTNYSYLGRYFSTGYAALGLKLYSIAAYNQPATDERLHAKVAEGSTSARFLPDPAAVLICNHAEIRDGCSVGGAFWQMIGTTPVTFVD